MMKKQLVVMATAVSLLLIPSTASSGAVKAGAACTKANSTTKLLGLTYTCIKSGKKLVWSKGVKLASPSATQPATVVAPIPQPMPVTPAQPVAPASSSLISNSIGDCQLKDQRTQKLQPNNVGFPYSKDLLPSSGVIKTVFVAVDFSDAPGVTDPSIDSEETASKMNKWFQDFAGGKVSISAQHSKQWFHSNTKSADISNLHPGIGGPSTANVADALAQSWINLTGTSFDFTGVQAIFFDFPNTVKGLGQGTQGRQSASGNGVILQTKQGPITVFYNTTGDYWYSDDPGASAAKKQEHKWSFYLHEMFHSMGLALHAPGNGMPLALSTQQTGTPEGFSGTLDAWESFLIGWLPDSSVLCLNKQDTLNGTAVLTARDEIKTGTKAAMVKLSDTKILVVESRRPTGWFNELPQSISGPMVYVVDTTLDNDRTHESTGDTGNQPEYSKWGYYLLPDGVTGGYSIHRGINDFVLRLNQSVTYEGVKITYAQGGSTDTIKIDKA